MSWCKLLIFFCTIFVLGSCASSGTLTGGPKDVKAPKLNEKNSSKNLQTNQSLREFTFEFDEYVNVKDVVKNVLVSPPLTYIPKVRARGKKVIFNFNEKEELKENTTYIINFGEAIQDYNESNPIKEFKYVFSTGDIIDSMEVKGMVYDVETNGPLKNASIFLYEDLRDSAVIKHKPYYYAKSNDKGEYSIQNVRSDTFRIIAIQDDNNNLIYNEPDEAIGFNQYLLTWTDSSRIQKVNIFVGKTEVPLEVKGTSYQFKGKLAIKLSKPIDKLPTITMYPTLKQQTNEIKNDSIIIWHKSFDEDSIAAFVLSDTLKFKKPSSKIFPKKLDYALLFSENALYNKDTMKIQFTYPIDTVKNELISFTDSLNRPIKFNIGKENRDLQIIARLESNKYYKLKLLPKAIKDYFGNTNDTIAKTIKTLDNELLSSIQLKISNLDSTQQYVINFLKSGNVLKKQIIKNVSSIEMKYDNLTSDTYSLLVIEDKNQNGKRDVINYWKGEQPEKIKEIKLDKLRESWIMEEEIDYQNITISTKAKERNNSEISVKKGK